MDASVIVAEPNSRSSSPLSDPPSPLPSTSSRPLSTLRSSARVAAATRAKLQNDVTHGINTASTNSKRTRTRRPAQTLHQQPQTNDRKGKKRALEQVEAEISEEEHNPPRKRQHRKDMSKKPTRVKNVKPAYGDAGTY